MKFKKIEQIMVRNEIKKYFNHFIDFTNYNLYFGVINNYFTDVITDIPIEYNFLKIYHKNIFQNTGLPKYIKIIHYVVKKPWQQKPLVILEEGTLWTERYWFEYYSKVLKYKLNG